jgi:hypothetical protein
VALTGSQLAVITEAVGTSAVSPSVSPAANSIVFVTVTFQGASLPAVSGVSGLGLTWAAGPLASAFDGSFSCLQTWWAATGGSAPAPGTVTVTFSVSVTHDGVVDQVTGLGVPLTLQGGASSVHNSASSGTTASVTSPAPQSAASFLYGATSCAGTETLTANGALTNIGSHTGGNEGCETQGATGITTSGVKCSATLSLSDGWGAVCCEVVTAGAAPGAGAGAAQPGQTWLRRFRHRQQLPPAPVTAAAPAAAPVLPGHPVMARQFPAAGGRVTRRAGTYAQAGPPARPLPGPVQARPGPQRGGRTASRAGTYAQAGPPVKAAAGPARARIPQAARGGQAHGRAGIFAGTGPALKALAQAVAGKLRGLPPRGRTASRAGTYAQAGPPVKAAAGPVQARRLPIRGGSAQGRTGTFTLVVTGSGPPVYPLGHPVQARRQPQRGGSTSHRTGTYAQAGAPARSAAGPVQARQPLPARGRTASRTGTFTVVVTGSGPPVYPLGHPAQARRQAAQGGRVIRRAGTYAQAGPPVKAASGPAGVWRRQPPPPARGRVASQRGTYAQAGPPVRPLGHALRGQPARPLLTGRAAWRAGTYTAPFVPPFTVGALTAADKAASVLTAAGAGNALTASTAAGSTLTAAAAASGTTAYPATYSAVYGPLEGTLTATDTRTGGPG